MIAAARPPRIESWNGFSDKGGTGKLAGVDKVRSVADHVNRILSYVPYVQTNFVLGLDDDCGDEPFSLTKSFVDLVPGAFPGYSILTNFQNAPLSDQLVAEGRTFSVPHPFLDNTSAFHVRIKNYPLLEFYDRMIDLQAHTFGARAKLRRWNANQGRYVKLANFARAITEGGWRRGMRRTNASACSNSAVLVSGLVMASGGPRTDQLCGSSDRRQAKTDFGATLQGMADTAVHLVDHVLPRAPYRQWVFTVPRPLRLPCARSRVDQLGRLRCRLGHELERSDDIKHCAIDDVTTKRVDEAIAIDAAPSISGHTNRSAHEFTARLRELAAGDEPVLQLIDCYREGITERRKVCRETGMTIATFHNADRRLKRLARRLPDDLRAAALGTMTRDER